VDRGYKVGEVAKRLGVTSKILHDWVAKFGDTGSQYQTITDQQEVRLLKAQLRRVTEERDILNEPFLICALIILLFIRILYLAVA